MTAVIRGGEGIVEPWVQACANAIKDATGADSFGTYPGHDPDISLATDVFVPVNSTDLGNAVTNFLMGKFARWSVHYIIYRQRIFNIERAAEGWRSMADRGSPTQNHMDHVHISFYPEGPPSTQPDNPPITGKELPDVFTYSTAPNVDGGSIWLVVAGVAHRIYTIDDASRINAKGVLSLGEMSEAFHNVFEHRG